MARTKKKVVQENTDPVNEDGTTAAADSLKPGSRSAMMMQVIQRLQGSSVEDLSHFLNDTLAQIGHEADPIPPDNAAKNAASIRTGVKEALEVVFGDDETLAEETRERIEVLFESAVNQRVAVELAEKVEELTANLDKQLDEFVKGFVPRVDDYMGYIAEKFFEENELAIESTIQSNVAKSFMRDLHELFLNHHISVPEDKMDLLGEMQTKINELTEQVNSLTEENMKFVKEATNQEALTIFREVSEGLTEVQLQKFQDLSEDLEYEDFEQLKKKLTILKEANFSNKPAPAKGTSGKYEKELLSEDVADSVKGIDPAVDSILRNLGRTRGGLR